MTEPRPGTPPAPSVSPAVVRAVVLLLAAAAIVGAALLLSGRDEPSRAAAGVPRPAVPAERPTAALPSALFPGRRIAPDPTPREDLDAPAPPAAAPGPGTRPPPPPAPPRQDPEAAAGAAHDDPADFVVPATAPARRSPPGVVGRPSRAEPTTTRP